MFVMVQRRRFTRRAYGDNRRSSTGYMIIDKFLKTRTIDITRLVGYVSSWAARVSDYAFLVYFPL